jgi:pimeloyl-ACP methyl ester carboxylesterase
MTTTAERQVAYLPASRKPADSESGSLASVTELFPSQIEEGFSNEGFPPEADSSAATITAKPPQAKPDILYNAHGQILSPGGHGDVINYTLTSSGAGSLIHLIDPGLGGFKSTSRRLGNNLAEEGCLSVRFGPGRKGDAWDDVFDPQKLHAETLAAIADDLPNNEQLKDIPGYDKIDFSKLAIVAHSMAGLSATRYALKHPDDVALIHYIETVGMEEAAVQLGFISRLRPTILEAILPAIIDQSESSVMFGLRALSYYFRNPKRSIGEAASCMRAKITDDVIALGHLGVKRSLILGGKDKLIPAKPSFEGAGHLVDYCEVIASIGHFGPQEQPELVAERVAFITRHLLEATS